MKKYCKGFHCYVDGAVLKKWSKMLKEHKISAASAIEYIMLNQLCEPNERIERFCENVFNFAKTKYENQYQEEIAKGINKRKPKRTLLEREEE